MFTKAHPLLAYCSGHERCCLHPVAAVDMYPVLHFDVGRPNGEERWDMTICLHKRVSSFLADLLLSSPTRLVQGSHNFDGSAQSTMASSTPSFSIGTRLNEKVCIITGSSSGLGRAVALAFAAQGTRLIVCADLESKPKSDFMAEEAGTPTEEVIRRRHGHNKAIFVKTNVTKGEEVEALVQAAVKAGGRLDV